MSRFDFDVIVIGLGPAGMAVSIMTAEMGLKVCGIEAHKIGGECMNVGCIPSKALLRTAKARAMVRKFESLGLAPAEPPAVNLPFHRVRKDIDHIGTNKTRGMFAKVELILGHGKASFVDPHTVRVGERRLSARRIYIAIGTRPQIPAIPGLSRENVLTNENLFDLDTVPQSLIVLGGGAIAVEMAQAFARLGSKVTMVLRGRGLMWREDPEATAIIERIFEQSEGISILRNRTIERLESTGGGVTLHTTQDGAIHAEKILVATGRQMDFSSMNLEAAGVEYSEKGIRVDKYLRTTARHIYAVGDCNGFAQLSHSAMHQGMIAVMNSLMPWPTRRDFRRFLVPWTVFTEPAFSWVGPRESELQRRGVRYEAVVCKYDDYGAAIAEKINEGFVKVLVSPTGRIYSAAIIGEGSGDSINEWALAIQTRRRMHEVMLLQHSFPSMAFLNKRVAETWMMNRMQSGWIRATCRRMFRGLFGSKPAAA